MSAMHFDMRRLLFFLVPLTFFSLSYLCLDVLKIPFLALAVCPFLPSDIFESLIFHMFYCYGWCGLFLFFLPCFLSLSQIPKENHHKSSEGRCDVLASDLMVLLVS